MSSSIVFLAALVSSALLTGVILRYARGAGLIDVPNPRSSHARPTPRGGGLSIAATFIVLTIGLYVLGDLPGRLFAALVVATLTVGAVGFVDDHRPMPPTSRFLVHVFAAAVVLSLQGGLPPFQVGSALVNLGWMGHGLALVFLVWLINLFNFMDGIDGLAAVEAAFILLAATLIGHASAPTYLSILQIGLAAACLGFLAWNWPPARIFMGDVGSGFLGLGLGAFAIVSMHLDVLPVWTWLILAGVFVVDATVTVVRRMLAGQRWYAAHRSHGYQRAARRLGSHRSVTLLVLAIDVLWLAPLALLAAAHPESGWWLWLLAWFPLVVGTLMLGAGRADER